MGRSKRRLNRERSEVRRLTQPAHHERKWRDAVLGGVSRFEGHAVALQQRLTESVPGIEVVDQGLRAAAIAVRMEHQRRIDLEVLRCGVGPGNGRDLVTVGWLELGPIALR